MNSKSAQKDKDMENMSRIRDMDYTEKIIWENCLEITKDTHF
jgi:hypothetical protein